MEKRFIVDSMLGSTVKWLRLLGFDAEYDPHALDEALLGKAAAEKRVLLTGDVNLYLRALKQSIETCLLQGAKEAERLAALAERFGMIPKVDPARSRCIVCNVPIERIDKGLVEGKVPKKVYDAHDEFCTCRSCTRVYWLGSHVKKMQSILEEVKAILDTMS